MARSTIDKLIKHYQKEYPKTAEIAEEYYLLSAFELCVVLNNGSKVLYDDTCKSLRLIPKDPNAISEIECKSEYGKRLYSIMKSQGIPQHALAEMTGVTQMSISNYITGKSSPSWYVADKIARALNVSMESFRCLDIRED
jgi:DNA-binding XRE family transcriptional regulator